MHAVHSLSPWERITKKLAKNYLAAASDVLAQHY